MRRPSLLIPLALAIVLIVTGGVASPPDPIEQLGKKMFQDLDFSAEGTLSCKSCHFPLSGFADPDNFRDPFHSFVSVGDDGVSLGVRNAPTAAYAGYVPALTWSLVDGERVYRGGLFRDGRAHGHALGDPLVEQAQGPPLNPIEMGMADVEAVVDAVRESSYATLFLEVFGDDALDDTDAAYVRIAEAIAAYERGEDITRFRSRFDKYWNRVNQGRMTGNLLNAAQTRGLELFVGRGGCSGCHAVEAGDAPAPLFTDHTYVNLGLPPNPALDLVDPDLGLGGFLRADLGSPDPLFADAAHELQDGKFRVPTLRNVPLTPPYGHNGVFPTLRSMIQFHNARDVGAYPAPEVPFNVTDRVGDLGLDDDDIDDLIAFLYALSD